MLWSKARQLYRCSRSRDIKWFAGICWPSRKDLEEPGLYFQTWVTSDDDPSDGSTQVEQARADVASQEEVDSRTYKVQHEDELDQVQESGDATITNNTSSNVRQPSIDSSSTRFDSDEETSALVVQTSDGASHFNDCVHSSSEESFIPSPQVSGVPVHEVRRHKAVEGLEVEPEARDVLRALPPDSEMRFASMVAAAQQAAAAALSAVSPKRNVGEGSKLENQAMPTPRRGLATPRSARTPRTGSKRDKKVTSSKKKKKKSSLSPEQQPATVHT